jgi:ubiquinone/menaquinone biosynthesis C-methylase UbiE
MLSKDNAPMLPVYPLIAQQILDDYAVAEGICLDIGTGPGYLGIELAKITNLEMYFVDMDPQALEKAKKNAGDCGLDNTIHLIGADVCALPFEDNFADLVISRGSLWFWEDQVKGLQEIYRVLKLGSIAFVGGGLGRYTPASMRQRLKGKRRREAAEQGKARFLNGDGMQELIKQTGLAGCRLVSDVEEEAGTWIEIRKPSIVAMG